MPSSSTITINQINYGIDLDQHLDHESGSTQLVNTHSDTSELVNTDSTLPTHHLPSHHTYPANGSNSNNHYHTPATVVRVGTFPPRSNNQTLYAYIVTNFTVITIVIAVITLVATVAGIIVAIVLAVIYKWATLGRDVKGIRLGSHRSCFPQVRIRRNECTILACPSCGYARCGNCHVTKVQVR
jgi:hypothetical protein